MNDVKAGAKAIFLEALDCKGADEMIRFLEQACRSDAAVRLRVEELMRVYSAEGMSANHPRPNATQPSEGQSFLR